METFYLVVLTLYSVIKSRPQNLVISIKLFNIQLFLSSFRKFFDLVYLDHPLLEICNEKIFIVNRIYIYSMEFLFILESKLQFEKLNKNENSQLTQSFWIYFISPIKFIEKLCVN